MPRMLLATCTAAALAAAASVVVTTATAPAATDRPTPAARADTALPPATTAPRQFAVRRATAPGATGRATAIAATDAPAPRTPPAAPVTPARDEPPAAPPLPTATSREGWVVAGGSSTDPIRRDGPTVRWTVEVEPATGLDVATVLRTAEDALHDPRSWARSHELERVDDPDRASVRVVVATPGTVDALCARAGLRTNGHFSCWNGRVAAINLDRWMVGTREVTDLAGYRAYVVNHEVGHALGRDHVACRAAGALADVMQQQTRTLAGCVANPWPYPAATG